VAKAAFVCFFEQSRPKHPVHFDGCANNWVGLIAK
jgi:hypothetical protein